MASVPTSGEMPGDLVRYLSGGRLVVVATVDAGGWPYTMVMNWAVACDPHTLRLSIDHRTQSLRNIRENGRAMVEVIGDGMVYGVRGAARVVVEQMRHAPIPSAMVEIAVDLVKRDLPDGVEVEAPVYRWGALEPYMSKLDPLGFQEMRTYSA
ncbi:MAG TPA: pyridoxamine 5'-phosphate oxidase family protein [Dehalococcoidia bacterium]|nr:pyridoxamine 5'-phosphate oxidase family protein [Dehalococcoidia bacterium]